jgi:hypothetical protein
LSVVESYVYTKYLHMLSLSVVESYVHTKYLHMLSLSVVESYVHTKYLHMLSLLKINAVDSEDVSFFAEFISRFPSL